MYSIRRIAAIVAGRLVRGDGATPRGIVHDSREVRPGNLFVALSGEEADGHEFLGDAFSRGACGALVSDPSSAPTGARNLVVVDDVLPALQHLAATWRGTLEGLFVGVTGSNGKTTTRSLLAHLLREPGRADAVFSAPGNFNTGLGLPLALLAMPDTASIGLFELGTERPGEIEPLCDILAPRIGLITSIGASHLAGFGSVEAVATEKWALVESLPQNGYAVLNVESEPLRTRAARELPGRCVTVGLSHGTVRGRIEQETPHLRLAVHEPSMRLESPLIGAHNATNLLLAAATAHRLGVSPDTIGERTRTFAPVAHRLQPIPVPFGTILDDTYNANPSSTACALQALGQLGNSGALRVFVFGDMLDLGPEGDRYHLEILDLVLRLGIDAVFPVGDLAVAACHERPSPAIAIVERDELAGAIRARCRGRTDAFILVKGSHAMALEQLVDLLTDGPREPDR